MKWNLMEKIRERSESKQLNHDRLCRVAEQRDREYYFRGIRDDLAVNIFSQWMESCDNVFDDEVYSESAVRAVAAANALVAELEQVSR